MGGERQVSTLSYCMGEMAEDTLNLTNISDDNRKDFKIVLEKFEDFFKVRRNTTFERGQFNRRSHALHMQ